MVRQYMDSKVKVSTSISEGEAERIFYRMWEEFGEEWINKLLEAEGYSPTKKIETL